MLRAVVLTEYRRVTDGQTDGIAIASTALAMRRAVKRTVQDRTGKKSQNGYVSPIWGEAPTEAIYTVNHKKRDILFLTITLDNLNRFL